MIRLGGSCQGSILRQDDPVIGLHTFRVGVWVERSSRYNFISIKEWIESTSLAAAGSSISKVSLSLS